jgi:hypothetical protein
MIDALNNLLKENSEAEQASAMESTKEFLTFVSDYFTPEEASKVLESANEFAAYGVVDLDCMKKLGVITDAPATESFSSKTRVQFNKTATLDRLDKRDCIMLAKQCKDSNYKNYKKYRDLMIQYREKIYHRYESKAHSLSRHQLNNMRNKTSSMNSEAGKAVTDKIDEVVKHADVNNHDK